MKQVTQTILNFDGFYDSIHSDNIFNYIEGNGLSEDEYNFKELEICYCNELINKINNELGTNIEFLELFSPKFYNFETDKIIANVSNNDILLISKYFKENYSKDYKNERLREFIKKCTAPKEGFIPFYSYDDFFKKENKQFLFECYYDLLFSDDELMANIVYDIELNY